MEGLYLTVHIFTSRLYKVRPQGYAVDVTVKKADMTKDYTFSPSWDIVMGHKYGRITDDQYKTMYYRMMLRSLKANPAKWKDLLSKGVITLMCFCKPGEFCHRVLLANFIVLIAAPHFGMTARYEKELI
jgi:uncharacterized protein YeaO (DUF488 family)